MPTSIMKRIKNEKLKNSISNIIQNAKEIHAVPFLYSFTDHGISHSERMLLCIDKLLNGCKQKNVLNEYECYVLIAAVYLHDIGIQESKEDVLTRFAQDNNLLFDSSDKPNFVRKYHHLISAFLIREDITSKQVPLVYDGDPELGRYISLVVESHGIDFSQEKSRYKTYIYHENSVRVHLLSVLLCLADSFDCDNRRIDSKKFRYTELPKISRLHWMKHLYIKGISFDNRVVTISYIFPVLTENEQKVYIDFFCNETEFWINKIKASYLAVLNEVNLVFDLKREIGYADYIDKLDLEDYSFIEGKIFDNIIASKSILTYKRVAIGVLLHGNSVLMVQRKNPEKSLSANDQKSVLKWQFPAGMVKTIDTPEIAVIREVFEETRIKSKVKSIIGKRVHPDTLTLCYYFALEYESGEIVNGDTCENVMVSWIPINEYKHKITSNIYWKVDNFLKEGNKDES